MKFEKHLKSTGVNAVIYKATNGNLFLRNGVFGNVLVRIPEGVAPVSSTVTRDLDWWMNNLVLDGSTEIGAQLAGAMIEPDGTPKDIKRIYRDVLITGEYGDRKYIINQDAYTLIERYDDIRIFSPKVSYIEEGIEHPISALVILDRNEETIGIILGE